MSHTDNSYEVATRNAHGIRVAAEVVDHLTDALLAYATATARPASPRQNRVEARQSVTAAFLAVIRVVGEYL